MDASTLLTSSLVAALVAFALSRAQQWQAAGQTSRAILRGILLEIDQAERSADEYLKHSEGKAWSPGNRVVIEFMRRGIPALAENGHIDDNEIRSLYELYIWSTEANRSLDELADMRRRPLQREDISALSHLYPRRETLEAQETNRARVKFQHVKETIAPGRAAAAKALQRLAWFEPQ